jgi:methyltransferase (TIGR00027 family)
LLADSPSRTAQGAALHRAAHQLVDQPPVFEDPLALKIVGAEAESQLRAGRDRRAGPQAAGLRAFIAVRSRYAEDCLADAFQRGVRQVVVLGAGLDTFAYRSRLDGLRVFEVDHPATQAWKRERLAQAAIPIPESVFYAAVDFERETVREGLARTPFDFSRPAFFTWLGVAPYLERDAIMETLGIVAREMGPGSEIVFDFATPPGADPGAAAAQKAFAGRVGAIGEPLKSAFAPEALAGDLRALGFSDVEVLDGAALQARYLAGRRDGLAVRRGQVMRARV